MQKRFPPITRIVTYALALVLVMGTFAAGAFVLAHKRGYWVAQLRALHLEGLELAGETKAAFRELNLKLLRYELSRQPADRTQFEVDTQLFEQWLVERVQTLAVPGRSREILFQMRVEYKSYRVNAEKFLASLPPVGAIDPADELLLQVEAASRRFQALETSLAHAQHAAFQALIDDATRDVDLLYLTLQGLMAMMLVCVGALAWAAYRDLIAPLRRTVRESHALLERQEKLNALGLVAAGLAHEIRNPLNSITARLFTQRRVLGEASPGLEDNRFIDEEINRLEGIVRQALQFARPGPPNLERFSLPKELNGVCELLAPTLRSADIQLRTDYQTDAEVSADVNQIRQAVLNLLKNAADSIGRGGTITVRTRPALLRGERRRVAAVALEVEDTGGGVAPEVQARLFDPFFTTKEHGTGLGLSITARIVQAHGGQIECQSQPGRGALFRILLPLAHEKDSRPAH